MKKVCLGAMVAAVALASNLSACSDSSSNSNVYSCDEYAENQHMCYESTEADFMQCSADGLPESFQKMVFTSGRGCAEGALVVCDAEVFPGHPYKVYVYTKDIAEMGCRRIVPSNRK